VLLFENLTARAQTRHSHAWK